MRKSVFILLLMIFPAVLFAKPRLPSAAQKSNSGIWYVNVTSTAVREKPSQRGKLIQEVPYASAVVMVNGSESKGWCQVILVSDPTKQGWIQISCITTKRIIADANRVTANADEIALAGKGFTASIEAVYADEYEIQYDEVDFVESYEIDFDEAEQFIAEGNLVSGEIE